VKLFILILLGLLLATSGMLAQTGTIIAGAGAVYHMPVGTLHNRFASAVGGMLYVGQQTSANWTWVGKFEYVEFSALNSDKLYKTINLQEGGVTQQYQIPLNKLSMDLTVGGVTAEAILNLVRWSSIETNAHVGFGFYKWENVRGSYYDSLFVQSSVTGARVKAAVLAVPENRQTDWSGSLNLGADLSVKIAEPVWFTLGADYRLIVAELWPALDLDLENVAGLQSISLRGGIKVEF